MQQAQKEIITRTSCIERNLNLTTVANQVSYTFSSLVSSDTAPVEDFTIENVIAPTNYNCPIKIISKKKYLELVRHDGTNPNIGQPAFITNFGGSIYLYPKPSLSGDIIGLWAYLYSTVANVSATVELEVQSYFDKAVEYYTISQFSEKLSDKYYPMFLAEIDKYNLLPHTKDLEQRQIESNW
jgi:hypothetical protein